MATSATANITPNQLILRFTITPTSPRHTRTNRRRKTSRCQPIAWGARLSSLVQDKSLLPKNSTRLLVDLWSGLARSASHHHSEETSATVHSAVLATNICLRNLWPTWPLFDLLWASDAQSHHFQRICHCGSVRVMSSVCYTSVRSMLVYLLIDGNFSRLFASEINQHIVTKFSWQLVYDTPDRFLW